MAFAGQPHLVNRAPPRHLPPLITVHGAGPRRWATAPGADRVSGVRLKASQAILSLWLARLHFSTPAPRRVGPCAQQKANNATESHRSTRIRPWEHSGRPEGGDEEFYHRAEQDCRTQLV